MILVPWTYLPVGVPRDKTATPSEVPLSSQAHQQGTSKRGGGKEETGREEKAEGARADRRV